MAASVFGESRRGSQVPIPAPTRMQSITKGEWLFGNRSTSIPTSGHSTSFVRCFHSGRILSPSIEFRVDSTRDLTMTRPTCDPRPVISPDRTTCSSPTAVSTSPPANEGCGRASTRTDFNSHTRPNGRQADELLRCRAASRQRRERGKTDIGPDQFPRPTTSGADKTYP